VKLAAVTHSRDDLRIRRKMTGSNCDNMNHKHLLMACMLATLAACATSTPKAPRTASVAPSVAPTAATATAAGATATQVNYDPRVADSDRKAKEMGFHIVMRDGSQYYCRTVAPMGTRIPQKECLRADAMQQQLRRMEEDKVNIRQFQYCGPSCVPPPNAQ
jgi:hypothetical protein